MLLHCTYSSKSTRFAGKKPVSKLCSKEVTRTADRRRLLKHHIEHLTHCGNHSPQIKHGLECREADEGDHACIHDRDNAFSWVKGEDPCLLAPELAKGQKM